MSRISLFPGEDTVSALSLRHRASLLQSHYPSGAVSVAGHEAAREFLQSGAGRAAVLLQTLAPELFIPYVPGLHARTGWQVPTWRGVLQSVSIFETMLGCVHECKMCYISAPPLKRDAVMPWPHLLEVFDEVASEWRRVMRAELLEVLVHDMLCGRLKLPISVLDAVLALVRHSRNRFANYSDHVMSYWKSNPTNWNDPLFRRDFADVCTALSQAFQLFRLEDLAALIDNDLFSQDRFRAEFGEDLSRLYFATTMHAVTSTVPFGKGSIGDQAVSRILAMYPQGSELIRVSIPHPNLIKTGEGNPARYWEAVRHSLQRCAPKLVYLFATTLDELLELVEHVAASYEKSEQSWWIESRLAIYEIRAGRARGDSDEIIVERLKKVLRRLGFSGALEGRAKQFGPNSFFGGRKTVMCTNGVVVAPNRELHYQACTDPAGGDLAEGAIIENIQSLGDDEVTRLVTAYPKTNRAREAVTPGLSKIPLSERRKPWNWFERTSAADRKDKRYANARALVLPLAGLLLQALRL